MIRRGRRALFDGRAWRSSAQLEYQYMTTAIRYLHGERILRGAVALLAMMMLPLALVMQFNPMGPQGVPARVVHLIVAVIGLLLGVRWLVGRWPSAREALWFLFLSDVSIGIAVAVLSDPTARISGTIHIAMVGLFAAFFLGWRILLLHCVYALVLIAGLTAYAILAEGRTIPDLYVYMAPAITTVVGLPVAIQVVVELGRHGAATLTQEWNVDSLTGAYSRRGMNLAVGRTASRAADDGFFLVGVLDLDGFKQFNDTHGHNAGDQLLRDVVTRLKTVPRLVVGRHGGDEFGLVAFRHTRDEAVQTLDELRALLRPRGDHDETGIPGSVGIVIAPGGLRERLDDLTLEADQALYEAKRSSSTAVVVRNLSLLNGDVGNLRLGGAESE